MELSTHDRKYIDDFLASLDALKGGLSSSSFNFLALKDGDQFVIVRARVFLVGVPASPPTTFESPMVKAGCYPLDQLKLSPRELLDKLLSGKITIGDQEFLFPPGSGGRHSPFHVPFHPEGLNEQRRLAALNLTGANVPNVDLTAIDWEIRASEVPFNGMSEVLGQLRLGPVSPGPCTVEFIRQNVAWIDTSKTKAEGTKAHIVVRLAPGLDQTKFRLGYRVQDKLGQVPMRGSVPNQTISWGTEDGFMLATTDLEIPAASVVNAIASYDGIAQHFWWFADPTTSQNPRRAVYQAFDPDFAIIRDVVAKAQGKNPEARTFEAAVAWIFWMLGFSPVHFGAMPKNSDVPDHLVVTPSGHYVVVECTAGLLKAENKLAILHDRAEAVRRALQASDHSYQKVVPVIITTKTREEVAVDLDQAERLGVHVITRDDFESILNQTLVLPNPEEVFSRIQESVAAATARHLAPAALNS